MLTTTALALSLAIATQATTDGPAARFDGVARVTQAIETVRPIAYRSSHVDWPALQADLSAQAAAARDPVDLLPIYHQLLQTLGDGHSFVQAPDEAVLAFEARHSRSPFVRNARKKMESSFIDRENIELRELIHESEKSIQWITVPRIQGAGDRAKSYAAHLFLATSGVHRRTCGYILDLRGNTGGNIWPMLTGLSGLLGDGPAGRQINADGELEIYAEIKEGKATVIAAEGNGQELMTSSTWRSVPSLVAAPVALLVDSSTASSGEGVAIAFRGRENSRIFGVPTFGVSTSNGVFPVADGVSLVVTVSVMSDRTGRAYPDGVTPDEEVAFVAPTNAGLDSQAEAARTWLSLQPACAAAS